MSINNTTGYKGVFRDKKRFSAKIEVNNKSIHIGNYDTPELAAEAYDEAAIKYHGAFALTNAMLRQRHNARTALLQLGHTQAEIDANESEVI